MPRSRCWRRSGRGDSSALADKPREEQIEMTREHQLDGSLFHHDWNNAHEPVLAIASGDVVNFDLQITGYRQVEEGSTIEDVVWDFDTIYNLAGPVRVDGAQPGDTLEIEILALTPGEWGWTGIIPGFGLLPNDFPD